MAFADDGIDEPSSHARSGGRSGAVDQCDVGFESNQITGEERARDALSNDENLHGDTTYDGVLGRPEWKPRGTRGGDDGESEQGMNDHSSLNPTWQGLAARHVGGVIDAIQSLAPRVWKVSGPKGIVVLKQSSSAKAFRQENEALHAWAERARQSDVLSVPRLLESCERSEERALVIEWVRSRKVPVDEELLGRAGRALRLWHEIHEAGSTDPLDPAEAMHARAHHAAKTIEGLALSLQSRRHLASLMDDWTVFSGRPRVFCHRDFEPRNWLIDQADGFWLIDLEHARHDDWLADLVRLREGLFAEAPQLEVAFFEGYGRQLDDNDRLCLDRWEVLHALQTLAWAQRHDDHQFVKRARSRLNARLAEDGFPGFG